MGIIKLDTRFAKGLGFTSDKFGGYLWKDGDTITISVIDSKDPGKGHLSKLFKTIESRKYNILVPSPLSAMTQILTKWGYKPHIVSDLFGPVEVWEKEKTDVPDNDSTPT